MNLWVDDGVFLPFCSVLLSTFRFSALFKTRPRSMIFIFLFFSFLFGGVVGVFWDFVQGSILLAVHAWLFASLFFVCLIPGIDASALNCKDIR